MAGTCIHGYAPGSCLICRTLDDPKAARTEKASTRRHRGLAVRADAPVEPHRSGSAGPRVVPKEAPPPGSLAVLKLVGLTAAVIAVIVVAWTVLHLVFVVLHILELVGVALVAGYVGWVVGVHRGHRDTRRGD